MSHIVTIIEKKKSIWIIQYCITEPIHVSCKISDACLNLLVVFHDHVLLELFIAQHCGYCRPPLRSVFVCCPCLVCVFTWEIGKSSWHSLKLIRFFFWSLVRLIAGAHETMIGSKQQQQVSARALSVPVLLAPCAGSTALCKMILKNLQVFLLSILASSMFGFNEIGNRTEFCRDLKWIFHTLRFAKRKQVLKHVYR